MTSFTGCAFNKKEENELKGIKQITLNAEQEKNAKIATETIKEQMLQLRITIPAQFKAMNKLLEKVYAPIDGKVINVFVEPGSIVKIGQPLIEVKSDTIGQIQLEFLDRYIEIDSSIHQMTAQYDLSVSTYKRETTLFKEGISSKAEYEVARAQMLKDKAHLHCLHTQKAALTQVYGQRVALYGGNASTITRAISTKQIYPYITLCSHKNGVVLNRLVNPGEIINQNKELFDVADLSTIWLVGYSFEKDAPLLKVGQKVRGVFEDTHTETAAKPHMETVEGKLSYVASMLDTERKTLEVIADIPNKNFSLKPNMYAEMVVDIGTKDVIAVPNGALQKYGDFNFAYVKVAPNTYEERKVEIGQHNDKYTEVKSGLNIGEVVVSNGGFSLLGESIKSSEE
jgi:cobalt-zinc-cadmium efflux system membrane fusion protein